MIRGRKTETYILQEKRRPRWTTNCSATARNLRKTDLAGVIFGCKHSTMKECYSEQLFGEYVYLISFYIGCIICDWKSLKYLSSTFEQDYLLRISRM